VQDFYSDIRDDKKYLCYIAQTIGVEPEKINQVIQEFLRREVLQ
tara:strand:- start:697 stop:828 length:132 start_codon:yes stop_codon:yes gene_type:complete